jgi:hypothetical protein
MRGLRCVWRTCITTLTLVACATTERSFLSITCSAARAGCMAVIKLSLKFMTKPDEWLLNLAFNEIAIEHFPLQPETPSAMVRGGHGAPDWCSLLHVWVRNVIFLNAPIALHRRAAICGALSCVWQEMLGTAFAVNRCCAGCAGRPLSSACSSSPAVGNHESNRASADYTLCRSIK